VCDASPTSGFIVQWLALYSGEQSDIHHLLVIWALLNKIVFCVGGDIRPTELHRIVGDSLGWVVPNLFAYAVDCLECL
jgi:predicted membrane protein